MTRSGKPRHAKTPHVAPVPLSREQSALRAATVRAMQMETIARTAYKLLADMERAGALRLPFMTHSSLMTEFRRAFGDPP